MKNQNLDDHHWTDIYTSLVYLKTPSRLMNFLILAIWLPGTYFAAQYIGENELSISWAFYLAFFSYLLATAIMFGYALLARPSINDSIKSNYAHSDLVDFDKMEAEVMSIPALNFLFGVVVGAAARAERSERYNQTSSSNRTRENAAKVALIFMTFAFLVWFIYTAPGRYGRIAFALDHKSKGTVIWTIVSETILLAVLIFPIALFTAALNGAVALDLTGN